MCIMLNDSKPEITFEPGVGGEFETGDLVRNGAGEIGIVCAPVGLLRCSRRGASALAIRLARAAGAPRRRHWEWVGAALVGFALGYAYALVLP